MQKKPSFSIVTRTLQNQVQSLQATVYQLMQQLNSYQDQTVSNLAQDAVTKVKALGVMIGDGTHFNPKQPVTREQLALILSRTVLADRP